MLIVIVIIALLASLTFPVFIAVRRGAYRTTALSNVKQIATANSLYSDDEDDVFCPYFSGYDLLTQKSDLLPSRYWPQLVSAYISHVTGRGYAGQALAEDLPKVFFDPVKPFKPQLGTSFRHGFISSWGISDDIVDWYAPDGAIPGKLPASRSSVVNPAGCVHMVETYDWLLDNGFPGNALALSPFIDSGRGAVLSVDAPYGASYLKTSAVQTSDPKGRNVVAFCDGHASSVVVGRLQSDKGLWSVSGGERWP